MHYFGNVDLPSLKGFGFEKVEVYKTNNISFWRHLMSSVFFLHTYLKIAGVATQ